MTAPSPLLAASAERLAAALASVRCRLLHNSVHAEIVTDPPNERGVTVTRVARRECIDCGRPLGDGERR